MAAFAEGMALGQSLGLDRDLLFDVLLGGPVVAPFVAMKREKMTSGNYDAEFPLQWMRKDLQMVSMTAFDTGLAMPLSHAAKEVYALAQQQGAGRDDFAAIYRFLSTTHPS
jgi:3-hydroxyisobutyrate dehydrogenase/glyoxylate/succinic semialdehyde reductase